MKAWIENDANLLALYKGIEDELCTHKATLPTIGELSRAKKLDEKTAIEKIQHLWRGYKVKESFVSDQYGSYISMIDKDDEQRLLSLLMFGRHEAEFRADSKDRMVNPFIHSQPYYHRADDLSGTLLNELKLIFDLEKLEEHESVIPVTNISLVSLEKYLQSINACGYRIIPKKDLSISLLVIDAQKISPNDLTWRIKSSGFTASPWEISQNITKEFGALGLDKTAADKIALKKNDDKYIKRKLANLPKTKEALIKSDIFAKLQRIAANKDKPTSQLAASIIKLIENNDNLSENAIKRIALIIDMANTFYVSNYQRFAICVYAIVHEISLALATETDKASFARFLSSSKKTFMDALALKEEDLAKVDFIASPALSGTNAFMIAKRIAATMHTASKPPTIEMLKPVYYELNTMELAKPQFLTSPDIYVFSTGPIVNPEGLTPGVDINKFIKDKIIKSKRTKPVTIIIDMTTTNYENLHLDKDAKQLIRDGKLSIVAFESHQKFGLLHTDQAQCGRVISLCGKGLHEDVALQQIQQDAEKDFDEHLDMRIGANISSNCADILDNIKRQHFSNGAIFRNILNIANLISNHIVSHKYMLEKLNELYFIVPKSWGVATFVTPRNSFGHYSTTLSVVVELARLCPNASDRIDSLILSSRIYLGLSYGQAVHFNDLKDLSLPEQIIAIAVVANRINLKLDSESFSLKDKVEHFYSLSVAFEACNSLKGRAQYEEIAQYLHRLKEKIREKIRSEADNLEVNPNFFKALIAAKNAKVDLTDKIFDGFKISPQLCNFMIFAPKFIELNNELITDLIEHPDTLSNIIKNKSFFDANKALFKKLQSLSINFDAKSLLILVADKINLGVLNGLIAKGFPFNSENIKMLGDKEFVAFIKANTNLSLESLILISEIYKAQIELNEETKKLIKDNPKFCQLMLMITNASNEILANLKKKDGGNKYKEALKYSPKYVQDCHLAIKEFCADEKSTKETRDKLLAEISSANDNYCEKVLSKHRERLTPIVEKILKGLLIALSITLILPLVPCFIGDLLKHNFFKTTSHKKLDALKTKLEEDIPTIKDSPKGKV